MAAACGWWCCPWPDWQVVLPLELNARVRCRWKDGEFYRCKVLERRINPEYAGHAADASHAWEYYVHFSSSKTWDPGSSAGAVTLGIYSCTCTTYC